MIVWWVENEEMKSIVGLRISGTVWHSTVVPGGLFDWGFGLSRCECLVSHACCV